MNADESKLRHQEPQQNRSAERQNAEELSFENAEDAIRHDAQSVSVPASLPRRLSDSIAKEPNSRRAWWRRLMGR